ncbi:MAG: ScaI family restriction endonuclease [Microcoleaceae cyanobacterium MO_207.B10]|nr:ScaI family restriction endonuclease [Microcoleaceae cyanobacterium MO_207.B10]
MRSPYSGLPVELWEAKTRELIQQHPLDPNEIYDLIVQVWHEIFQSNITSSAYKIGIDLYQIRLNSYCTDYLHSIQTFDILNPYSLPRLKSFLSPN